MLCTNIPLSLIANESGRLNFYSVSGDLVLSLISDDVRYWVRGLYVTVSDADRRLSVTPEMLASIPLTQSEFTDLLDLVIAG